MSRRRAASSNESAWAKMNIGTQNGLKRLVMDNKSVMIDMLEHCEGCTAQEMAEKCAAVIRQQQLTPSSFLARFFDADILREHARLLGKSDKGNAMILAGLAPLVLRPPAPFSCLLHHFDACSLSPRIFIIMLPITPYLSSFSKAASHRTNRECMGSWHLHSLRGARG